MPRGHHAAYPPFAFPQGLSAPGPTAHHGSMAMVQTRSRRLHVDDPRVRWLVGGAVVWTAAMVPVVLFAPLVSSSSSATDGRSSTGQLSLVAQGDGLEVVAALLVPVGLSLVAWFWGQRSRTAIVAPALLYDLAVVGAVLSVGILFAPAAIALTVAALARRD